VRLTGDPDASDDIAQEAFVRLLERDVRGDPAGIRAWLFKVVTHLVRDRVKVTRNRERLLERNPWYATPTELPDRAVERNEQSLQVRRALDVLEERERTLLLMREEGFDYGELAEVVGVKASSVGTLLARARKRFAEALDGHGIRPDENDEHAS
jgi:RNA polymerase sigma factor (sigma-70 family)